MDPLETINPKEDSTFVIAKEAQDRGYKIFHYLAKDISLKNKKKIFKKEKKVTKNLEDFDCILVRQDPPFNLDYITSTYFLDLLDKKVLVLNNPTEIRNNPEKLSIFNFKNLMTKTLVSENLNEIIQFIKSNQFTILKPLYGNGGEGIEKVSKNSINNKKLILKMLKKYKSPIVAQKFIKEIQFGDRRIILFDGEYMGSVARIPKQGSIKANFHSGGIAKKTGYMFRDKAICLRLKSFLKKNDLFFAGIDVIGNYLTEINITSPTGIQEINRLNNVRLEKVFWDKLEKKLN